MALRVEEIGRTQVLVTFVVFRVEAACVNRQLEAALTLLVDLEPSAEAVEATLGSDAGGVAQVGERQGSRARAVHAATTIQPPALHACPPSDTWLAWTSQ